MPKKSNQIIHLRRWDHRRAVTACTTSTDGTTSPNVAKVTCQQCKAILTAGAV